MQKNMKWVAVILVLVAGFWFYYTPYVAVNNVKKALAARDAVALADYVNFPALRENLKANLGAELARKQDNPLQALGAALVMVAINPIVDTMLTPEGLALMMQGNRPDLLKDGRNRPRSEVESGQTADSGGNETQMGYEGFDRFIVTVKKKASQDAPMVFVFHREGLLAWKLAGLRLSAKREGN